MLIIALVDSEPVCFKNARAQKCFKRSCTAEGADRLHVRARAKNANVSGLNFSCVFLWSGVGAWGPKIPKIHWEDPPQAQGGGVLPRCGRNMFKKMSDFYFKKIIGGVPNFETSIFNLFVLKMLKNLNGTLKVLKL